MWYNIIGGEIMAYKPSQSKAVTKYISKAYDQVSLRIPKGERERYKAHAESKGTSLNALIIELLEEDIKKSGSSDADFFSDDELTQEN